MMAEGPALRRRPCLRHRHESPTCQRRDAAQTDAREIGVSGRFGCFADRMPADKATGTHHSRRFRARDCDGLRGERKRPRRLDLVQPSRRASIQFDKRRQCRASRRFTRWSAAFIFCRRSTTPTSLMFSPRCARSTRIIFYPAIAPASGFYDLAARVARRARNSCGLRNGVRFRRGLASAAGTTGQMARDPAKRPPSSRKARASA